MISENTLRGNLIASAEKGSTTGAAVNLKKLLKTVKRIFIQSKPKTANDEADTIPSFATEEEFQNWLNEQIENQQQQAAN